MSCKEWGAQRYCEGQTEKTAECLGHPAEAFAAGCALGSGVGEFAGAETSETVAAEEAEQEGISVYQALDEEGNVRYVGITNDLERRTAEHAANGITNIEEIVSGLTRLEARGVEQTLIDEYGLARNGQLINKINSIARSNPLYAPLTSLGSQILQGIGYF